MGLLRRIATKFDDAIWWVLHRVHPEHRYHVIRTGLRPGFHEIDERLLHGSMSLLVDYVTSAGGVAAIEALIAELKPDHADLPQIEADEEVLRIYRWWTEQRPRDMREIAELASRMTGILEHDEELFSREEALDKIDDDMLARVISIRRALWN